MTQDNQERDVQSASGTGIAQTTGDHSPAQVTFFNLPIERILTALLVTSLIVQMLGYLALSCGGELTPFCLAGMGVCYPLVFGIPAIYGFVVGTQQEEQQPRRRLIWLSVASGLASVLPTLVVLAFMLLGVFAAAVLHTLGVDANSIP